MHNQQSTWFNFIFFHHIFLRNQPDSTSASMLFSFSLVHSLLNLEIIWPESSLYHYRVKSDFFGHYPFFQTVVVIFLYLLSVQIDHFQHLFSKIKNIYTIFLTQKPNQTG